jgi:glycosyltransferase involved in cell wall biosynthesis
MSALPRFSAIMAAYNYRAYIGEAIASALNQTQPLDELIVIDDGSTDGTAEWLQTHYAAHPVVRLVCRDNRGQLASFVEGAALARGDVIAFLDADDLWEPGYLAAIARVYAERPEVDFVYTNLRFFGEREGTYSPETRSRDLGLSVLLGAYEPVWQATATSGLSLRRSLAAQVLDIPADYHPLSRTRADDWLNAGADILGGRKYFLAEPLARYRAHGSNVWLGRQRNPVNEHRHWITVEKMLGFYRRRAGLPPESEARLRGRAKHEFRTKSAPTVEELLHYQRMLKGSNLRWNRRLEHMVAMWAHYWRHRRG